MVVVIFGGGDHSGVAICTMGVSVSRIVIHRGGGSVALLREIEEVENETVSFAECTVKMYWR